MSKQIPAILLYESRSPVFIYTNIEEEDSRGTRICKIYKRTDLVGIVYLCPIFSRHRDDTIAMLARTRIAAIPYGVRIKSFKRNFVFSHIENRTLEK